MIFCFFFLALGPTCTFHSPSRGKACASSASKRGGAVWRCRANAHARLASSRADLNSSTMGAATAASVSKRARSGWPDHATE